MLNIILFGPPGAGKGLQAKKIAERYGLKHLSTGELIRQEISSGSQLGRDMEEYISRGELAPDDLVLGMVADYFRENPDIAGTIFDGFPRTLNQAEQFDRLLEERGHPVNVMLALQVPHEEATKRILKRGKREGRSDDFTEETIRNRLSIYDEVTAPVAGHYLEQSKYVPVEGLGNIEEIFEKLVGEIEKHI